MKPLSTPHLRLFVAAVVAASTLVVGTGPAGCGGAGSGTTGRRIALDVTIAASPGSRQFTNARGWDVSITKALVATGALYFFDGDTLFAGAPASPRWSPFRSAFAHPGHYVPGNAKGEMRTPWSADLLAGGALGAGDGVSGFARSATFSFSAPAAGPAAAELGASVLVLEGAAKKGDEQREFRAEIDPDDLRDDEGAMNVEGCPFVAADMQGDGAVAIEVKIPLWLDRVDFDDVPPSADAAPVLLADGLAKNQLVRGMKGGLVYVFSYSQR